jgi:hypothetical protein
LQLNPSDTEGARSAKKPARPPTTDRATVVARQALLTLNFVTLRAVEVNAAAGERAGSSNSSKEDKEFRQEASHHSDLIG